MKNNTEIFMLCTRLKFFTFFLTLTLAPFNLFGQDTAGCADKLIKYNEYKEAADENYFLKINHMNGAALLYFGAQHSDNPADIQFGEIRKAYMDFKPEVVFYEGPRRPLGRDEEETIKLFGESGFIRFLAQRDSIPVESLEPNPVNELKFMLKKFTPEQAVLFYVLREASRLRERKNASPEEIKENIAQLFSRLPRFEGLTIKNIEELEKAYNKYWKEPAMWYDAPSRWFDPLKTSKETGGIFTNELNAESSHYRNVHMYEILTKTVKDGKRVFAVVGRNHVPMQREALKCALQQ
ncbi:MAG: hypothetical protein ACM3Q2_07645 [Syntrophothermus sp.]